MVLENLRERIDEITRDLIEKLKERSIYPETKPNYGDIDPRIGEFYCKFLSELCSGDNKDTEKAAGLDRTILELCSERVVDIGRKVAMDKVEKDPYILELDSDEEIKERITDKKREDEVIEGALTIARSMGFNKEKLVRNFFKGLIYLTTETQIIYIRERKGAEYESRTNVS